MSSYLPSMKNTDIQESTKTERVVSCDRHALLFPWAGILPIYWFNNRWNCSPPRRAVVYFPAYFEKPTLHQVERHFLGERPILDSIPMAPTQLLQNSGQNYQF